jgi:hypothetical protein
MSLRVGTIRSAKRFLNTGFRPAVCGYCLAEDLDTGRSQHVRLSWYCSVTTICPSHRTPLRQCCHDFIPVSDSCGHHREHHTRLHCGSCSHMVDDFSLSGRIDEIACASLANFESALCRAISGKHVSIFSGVAVPGDSLLQFVQDVVWALMRPASSDCSCIAARSVSNAVRIQYAGRSLSLVIFWIPSAAAVSACRCRRHLATGEFVVACRFRDSRRRNEEVLALAKRKNVSIRCHRTIRPSGTMASHTVRQVRILLIQEFFYRLRNRNSTN